MRPPKECRYPLAPVAHGPAGSSLVPGPCWSWRWGRSHQWWPTSWVSHAAPRFPVCCGARSTWPEASSNVFPCLASDVHQKEVGNNREVAPSIKCALAICMICVSCSLAQQLPHNRSVVENHTHQTCGVWEQMCHGQSTAVGDDHTYIKDSSWGPWTMAHTKLPQSSLCTGELGGGDPHTITKKLDPDISLLLEKCSCVWYLCVHNTWFHACPIAIHFLVVCPPYVDLFLGSLKPSHFSPAKSH